MERTGTNYLKRLLLINFSNVEVFSSELGWKHGMYHLYQNYDSPRASSHLDWLNKKTTDGIVKDVGVKPLKQPYSYYDKAIKEGLHYLISFKPVEYWIGSIKSFRFRSWGEMNINDLIKTFYEYYNDWLDLPGVVASDAIQMLQDDYRNNFLYNIESKFRLTRSNEEYINEEYTMPPCSDNECYPSETRKFLDRKIQYINGNILNNIPESVLDSIQNEKEKYIHIQEKINQHVTYL